ncbi:MAG: sulfur carrier protein ThiS [Candidatus Porifericomitaceae bacterium WSBS_2022_MAG_OTU9]
MQIRLNGKALSVTAGSTVSSLLRQMQVEGRIAVEINGSIVVRSAFLEHQIQDGDQVEIVHAVGGG